MYFSSTGTRRWRGSSLCAHFTAAVLILGFGCTSAFASDAPATPAAKQGDQIFHQRCVVCHNKQPDDTTPFGPPNLYKVFRSHTMTTAQAETIISNGKGQMPAFKTILTKPEIKSVISYLRSR